MQRPSNATRRASQARLQRVTCSGSATTARRYRAIAPDAVIGFELLDARPAPKAMPAWGDRRIAGPGALDMGKMTPAQIEAYINLKREEHPHA